MAERPTAIVVGAGVVGLACALRLADRFDVTVVAPEGPTASTVAAGMLAPAAEALTDPLAPPLALMREALAQWPAFAAACGEEAALSRCGSLVLPECADAPPAADADVGALVGREQARRLQPAAAIDGAIWCEEDARVEVGRLTAGLTRALQAAGVRRVRAQVQAAGTTGVRLAGGKAVAANQVVVAAGPGTRRLHADAALLPIKGQLIRFTAGGPPAAGAMVRAGSGYLCPSTEGAMFGATMEPGADDLRIDTEVAARFAAAASALAPSLGSAAWRAGVGVRAATADGLPLVGRATEGVILATGFRRNGWLLAPLAAAIVAAVAAGEDPGPWADALRPGRFG